MSGARVDIVPASAGFRRGESPSLPVGCVAGERSSGRAFPSVLVRVGQAPLHGTGSQLVRRPREERPENAGRTDGDDSQSEGPSEAVSGAKGIVAFVGTDLCTTCPVRLTAAEKGNSRPLPVEPRRGSGANAWSGARTSASGWRPGQRVRRHCRGGLPDSRVRANAGGHPGGADFSAEARPRRARPAT